MYHNIRRDKKEEYTLGESNSDTKLKLNDLLFLYNAWGKKLFPVKHTQKKKKKKVTALPVRKKKEEQ